MRHASLALAALAAGLPSLAHAAGLGIPDLGASALSQGAATVAAPDDGSAAYYNPASLASQRGLRAYVDLRFIRHELSFQRTDAEGRTSDPEAGWEFSPVSNKGPVKLAPMFAVSYALKKTPIPITIAIGGHPATGYSGYDFPNPTELRNGRSGGTIDAEVEKGSPQRYMLITNDSLSYTFDLAVAAQLTDKLSVGLDLQSPYVRFRTSESLYANANAPGQEIQGWDAILHIDATDAFTPTASLGVSALLPADLRLGASLQLPADIHAKGTLQVEKGPVLTAAKAEVKGDQIDLDVKLPWIARVGLRIVKPLFEAELAFTYDAWGRYQEVVLTPHDISFVIGNDTKQLSTMHLEKGLVDAQSLRLGGMFKPGALKDSLKWLTIRAGLLGETSAVPMERTALDQAHWERLGLTCGLGAHLADYDLVVGYAHFLQPDRQVRTSEVKQPSVTPEQATIVGNGNYHSQFDVLAVAASGSWDL